MKHFERVREHVEIGPILAEVDAQPSTGEEQDASLARARIARLAPGFRVHPHVDRGDYYRRHDRYHLVLRSPAGSLLRAGDEQVRMREGELWWFDNKAVHDAVNQSDTPRIHLIFDLEPRSSAGLRSPPPVPSGCADDPRDLSELLRDARDRAARQEAELVQEAVRLYLAGRQQPYRWTRLLQRSDFRPTDEEFRPMRANIRLISGDAGAAALRRQARAMVWALERLERGELRWDEVAEAICREGGVRAVARAWRKDQLPR